MRKRDRAMVAAAKPLRGGSTKRCQLHIRVGWQWEVGHIEMMRQLCETRWLLAGSWTVGHASFTPSHHCTPSIGHGSLPILTQLHAPTPQATYYTFSDAEEKLIMRGQRQGMAAVLDSPEVRWGTSRLPDCCAWACACRCGHSLPQHGAIRATPGWMIVCMPLASTALVGFAPQQVTRNTTM